MTDHVCGLQDYNPMREACPGCVANRCILTTLITRNLSTPESREYWERAEQNAKQCADWPDWKKAGINVANESKGEAVTGRIEFERDGKRCVLWLGPAKPGGLEFTYASHDDLRAANWVPLEEVEPDYKRPVVVRIESALELSKPFGWSHIAAAVEKLKAERDAALLRIQELEVRNTLVCEDRGNIRAKLDSSQAALQRWINDCNNQIRRANKAEDEIIDLRAKLEQAERDKAEPNLVPIQDNPRYAYVLLQYLRGLENSANELGFASERIARLTEQLTKAYNEAAWAVSDRDKCHGELTAAEKRATEAERDYGTEKAARLNAEQRIAALETDLGQIRDYFPCDWTNETDVGGKAMLSVKKTFDDLRAETDALTAAERRAEKAERERDAMAPVITAVRVYVTAATTQHSDWSVGRAREDLFAAIDAYESHQSPAQSPEPAPLLDALREAATESAQHPERGERVRENPSGFIPAMNSAIVRPANPGENAPTLEERIENLERRLLSVEDNFLKA